MKVVLITGSAGLIGSESVRFFCERGFKAVGLDNDMRRTFFGEEASTAWNRGRLLEKYQDQYIHYDVDIRDRDGVKRVFDAHGKDIDLIIHTAAQPSHDWAATDPYTDFTVNANGTLVMLENARQLCPEATFIFCSTNKVYGDRPNSLPLVEQELRWEVEKGHACYNGIDETMSIDNCKHSLFGASKVAADVLVQEYGRYFEDGCLSRRLPDGAQSLRHEATRLPVVSHEMYDDRESVSGPRIQRQAGTRQHSQLRSGECLLPFLLGSTNCRSL